MKSSNHTKEIIVGSRLELMIDSHLIQRTKRLFHRLVLPRDEGEVFRFDQPWEGLLSGYSTVLYDNKGEVYRLYYRGLPDGKLEGSNGETTCMAVSDDGIKWRRPHLHGYKIDGQDHNNVILADAAPDTHNFTPFIDINPELDRSTYYKALGGLAPAGLMAYGSPDGIKWRLLHPTPVITDGMLDSQNVSFWSESEECYVCYLRSWTGSGFSGWRSVSRCTSKDFINWSKPREMSYGPSTREHLYTNQTQPYFRAPHIYLGLAARFMENRQVLSRQEAESLRADPEYFQDCSDVVLLSSRGGNRYQRSFMEALLRPGLGLQHWVSRTNFPALGLLQTSPTELSFYVNQHYAQPSAHLRRYSLTLDRFAGFSASAKPGELITKPLIFEGAKLLFNFSTSAAGGIRVELQRGDGQPIPQYGLEDCDELIGNEIERAVSWGGQQSIEALQGKALRLRVIIRDADLFALRFGP